MTDNFEYNARTYRVAKATRKNDDSGLTRLGPDQLDHVTLSAEVPTEGIGYPRLNWLADTSNTIEEDFIDRARGMDLDPDASPSEWRHVDLVTAQTIGPCVTLDVHEADSQTVERLVTVARRLEDEFLDEVNH